MDQDHDRLPGVRSSTTSAPVNSLNDPNLSVTPDLDAVDARRAIGPSTKIGEGTTAPNNVGKNSFPNYEAVAPAGDHHARQRHASVYVGPSEDPFAIDVGRIFDLIGVGGKGTDNLAGFNVGIPIAIQVPLSHIRQSDKQPVIGGWAAVDRMVAGKSDSSSRQKRSTAAKKSKKHPSRSSAKHWVQVERLGQPLINEVIIPRGLKDYWNSVGPDKEDYESEKYYTEQNKPGQLIDALNGLLLKPLLTGAPCSPPAATGPTGPAQETGRADLSAILLRGFKYPNDSTAALDLTFGKHDAGKPVDELRLNTTVPATPSIRWTGAACCATSQAQADSRLSPARPAVPRVRRHPNGRRLGDDVTDIEIAALIGLPIDNLIPSGIQRATILALGGPNLPDTWPVPALKFGADGVPLNDANGGVFGNAFPYLNTELGQQVSHGGPPIRSRSIAARAGLALGIAALVVAGGLLAGLRGGEGPRPRRPRPARCAPRSTRSRR